VPDAREAGIELSTVRWWGLAAPKGVPQGIVDRLNAELVKLYREPKFVSIWRSRRLLPASGTPAEFAAFLKKDRQDAEFADQNRKPTTRGLQARAMMPKTDTFQIGACAAIVLHLPAPRRRPTAPS